MAQAGNIGFERLTGTDRSGLSRTRPSWVSRNFIPPKQNYLKIVGFQLPPQSLMPYTGDGMRACAARLSGYCGEAPLGRRENLS